MCWTHEFRINSVKALHRFLIYPCLNLIKSVESNGTFPLTMKLSALLQSEIHIVAMGDFVDLLRSAIQGIFGSLRS